MQIVLLMGVLQGVRPGGGLVVGKGRRPWPAVVAGGQGKEGSTQSAAVRDSTPVHKFRSLCL